MHKQIDNDRKEHSADQGKNIAERGNMNIKWKGIYDYHAHDYSVEQRSERKSDDACDDWEDQIFS